MADEWIKIRVDLTDDPNVFLLSDLLDLDCPTTVGHLVAFWSWMNRHTSDGTGIKLTKSAIDRKINVSGFAESLIKIGWLSGEEMNFSIPMYERHNGNSAKARALDAEAKRIRRAMKSQEDTRPAAKLEEKKPSEKKAEKPPSKTTQKTVSDKCRTKSISNVGLEKRREEKNKDIQDSNESCCNELSGKVDWVSFKTNKFETEGELFFLDLDVYHEYKKVYQGFDVDLALQKISLWLTNNATRRKTHNGMPKFIGTWLSKEQNNSPRQNSSPGGNYARNPDDTEWFNEISGTGYGSQSGVHEADSHVPELPANT